MQAGDTIGVLGKLVGQGLNGHIATKLPMLRLMHFPHAALAELRSDFVMREFFPIMDTHTSIRRSPAYCYGKLYGSVGLLHAPTAGGDRGILEKATPVGLPFLKQS